MLAHVYDPVKHDPAGWLMSEKLDGVRCFYDGKHTLYSRQGKEFFAPKWWLAKLPPVALDGELWTKRDDFQTLVSIVRKKVPQDEGWKNVKFMVFDAPTIKGNFKSRLAAVEKEIARDPERAAVV